MPRASASKSLASWKSNATPFLSWHSVGSNAMGVESPASARKIAAGLNKTKQAQQKNPEADHARGSRSIVESNRIIRPVLKAETFQRSQQVANADRGGCHRKTLCMPHRDRSKPIAIVRHFYYEML